MTWAVCCLLGTLGTGEESWPHFRGPGHLSFGAGKPPLEWSATRNVAWKAPLPGRGLSGPVVAGGRVYLTSSEGAREDRLSALAFDLATGKQLWRRDFRATGRTGCHPKMCMATPTGCTDGERFVAFYSCNDVACFSKEGDLLWLRGLGSDYPACGNSVGMSSSPVIVDGVVVCQVECQADSFAVGLDLADGRNRWKLPRSSGSVWTSPLAAPPRPGVPPAVLLQSGDCLTAHEAATGRELWRYAGRCNVIPTATFRGDQILLPTGEGLALLDLSAAKRDPQKVWSEPKLNPSTPSPVTVGDRVYVMGGRGVLTAGDATTGKVLWQQRLKGAFSATPVAAAGRLYCFNEEGACFVVGLDDAHKVLATNDLGEGILGSPAVVGDGILVRSDKHLWRLAAP